MAIYVGGVEVTSASGVYVGGTKASEVYLGTTKVWPTFTPVQSGWYSPDPRHGFTVPWMAGASKVDVIMIGGGAGGDGTGIGGNAQIGGGAGPWGAGTISVNDSGSTVTSLGIVTSMSGSNDGKGGTSLTTAGNNGSFMSVTWNLANGGNGSGFASNYGLRKGSTTGNRNGGSVAPSFTYNGRTYTVASYGAGAGQGGAGSSNGGASGTIPGGGGQGGANGGLTGNGAGDGARGAVILYWY